MAQKKRNVVLKNQRRRPSPAQRPLGVTILSILGFVAALLLVVSGIVLLVFAELGRPLLRTALTNMMPMFDVIISVIIGAIGVVVVVLGIVTFVISYGLWNMKRWAWVIGMILLGLGAIKNLVSLIVSPLASTVSLAIDGLILYYLWTNRELFK